MVVRRKRRFLLATVPRRRRNRSRSPRRRPVRRPPLARLRRLDFPLAPRRPVRRKRAVSHSLLPSQPALRHHPLRQRQRPQPQPLVLLLLVRLLVRQSQLDFRLAPAPVLSLLLPRRQQRLARRQRPRRLLRRVDRFRLAPKHPLRHQQHLLPPGRLALPLVFRLVRSRRPLAPPPPVFLLRLFLLLLVLLLLLPVVPLLLVASRLPSRAVLAALPLLPLRQLLLPLLPAVRPQ